MSETTKTGLFDTVMNDDENAIKAEQKALTKSRLQRRLYSAYDSASEKKMESVEQLSNMRKSNKFANYDVNAVLAQKKTIAGVKEIQDAIKAEYLELFGEEMKPVDV
jgi:acetyl-CoA carboxylase carboxyltransferase component